jgi:cytochrome c-type biogenesis protein CcmH/NrfF
MLSEKLIAAICDDVGRIYQLSCETDSEAVIASELFQEVAKKIRREKPGLDDANIFALMLQVYSEVIRNQ